MPGFLQPLGKEFPIINSDGTPTEYFIRWAQQRQIEISEGISSETALQIVLDYVEDWSQNRDILAGTGLSGGGNLSSDVSIDLENTSVIPGSYTNTDLTVDAQGRITAASSGSGGGGGGLSYLSSNRWRLRCLDNRAAADCGFSELAYLDNLGANLCVGGTASASSFIAGFPPSNAFDGSTATSWYSTNSSLSFINAWIEYQFLTPVTPVQFRLTPDPSYTQGSPTLFVVEAFIDARWISPGTVYARAGIGWQSGAVTLDIPKH